MTSKTNDIREIQFGGGVDLEFAEYIKDRLKVFTDLEVHIEYNEYFKSYYLSGTLPSEHNPDYILGLVDGTIHEHKRISHNDL